MCHFLQFILNSASREAHKAVHRCCAAQAHAKATRCENLCVGSLEEAIGESFGDNDYSCACNSLYTDANDCEPPMWTNKGINITTYLLKYRLS